MVAALIIGRGYKAAPCWRQEELARAKIGVKQTA